MFEHATATFDQRHHGFFDSDEPRQVWALDERRQQIVYLPEDGVDDSVRQACRQERLRCPVARCPDPRLIAKGGSERRHHFAHKVAHTRHDSAAVFRTEAVAMLAAWARRYRGAQISTRDEHDLGIVTIRSAVTGKAIELAVTYDPRHDHTQTAAPDRQLLVGHTPVLLLPRSEHPLLPGAWCCGDARLVGELIHAQGVAIAVNPERRLVATLLRTRVAERVGLAPKDASSHPTICLVNTIENCHLDQQGTLTTPALQTLRAWQQRFGPAASTRRPRAKRSTRPPAAVTAPLQSTPGNGVDALPAATAPPPRAARNDINRIVIGGHVASTPIRHVDGLSWTVSIHALNAPSAQIDVVIHSLLATTTPVDDRYIVVHGQLERGADDSAMTVRADGVELYRPTGRRPARCP